MPFPPLSPLTPFPPSPFLPPIPPFLPLFPFTFPSPPSPYPFTSRFPTSLLLPLPPLAGTVAPILFQFTMNPFQAAEGTPEVAVCIQLASGSLLTSIQFELDPTPNIGGASSSKLSLCRGKDSFTAGRKQPLIMPFNNYVLQLASYLYNH